MPLTSARSPDRNRKMWIVAIVVIVAILLGFLTVIIFSLLFLMQGELNIAGLVFISLPVVLMLLFFLLWVIKWMRDWKGIQAGITPSSTLRYGFYPGNIAGGEVCSQYL